MWLVFVDNNADTKLYLAGGNSSAVTVGAPHEIRTLPRYYGYNNSYRYIKVPNWISAISSTFSRLSSPSGVLTSLVGMVVR